MPHGYGSWTFGWIAGERLSLFNERWRRLTAIHVDVKESLLTPLDDVCLSQRDCETLLRLTTNMSEWCEAIASNLPDTTSASFAGYAGASDRANGNHLRSYAAAIKNVVLKAAKLCQKHRIPAAVDMPAGESVAVADSKFAYDAQRKMITVNGSDLYFLGSGEAKRQAAELPSPNRQRQQPTNQNGWEHASTGKKLLTVVVAAVFLTPFVSGFLGPAAVPFVGLAVAAYGAGTVFEVVLGRKEVSTFKHKTLNDDRQHQPPADRALDTDRTRR